MADVYHPTYLPRYEDTDAYRAACKNRGQREVTVLGGGGRRAILAEDGTIAIGVADVERPRGATVLGDMVEP